MFFEGGVISGVCVVVRKREELRMIECGYGGVFY